MNSIKAIQNRVHHWIDRSFPQYLSDFGTWEVVDSLQILKRALFPDEQN